MTDQDDILAYLRTLTAPVSTVEIAHHFYPEDTHSRLTTRAQTVWSKCDRLAKYDLVRRTVDRSARLTFWEAVA